jgi:hypothetical protein
VDVETRNAVRRAISGQDAEPVTLQTDPAGEGTTGTSDVHDHAPSTVQLSGDAVLEKMQQLYPTHFAHCVAEAKCDLLVAQLESR